MFWHIDVDIVSLIVLCALYVCAVQTQPQQNDSLRDRRFKMCLWTGIVVSVIDIAASVAMEVPTSRFVYHLLMTMDFISLQLVIVAWIYYALVILYQDDVRRRRAVSRVIILPFLIYSLIVCSNPWTGIIYTLGEGNAYQRGPLFFLMVVVYSLYVVWLLALIFSRRKHIPPDYPWGVLLLIPVVVTISVVVQLLIPGWLMILPGYMICMVLTYLFLQTVRYKDERAQQAQLVELVEHVSCGFAVSHISKDHQLSMEYLNDGYFAICETQRSELTKRYEDDILSGIYPEDRALAREKLKELAEQRRNHDIVYRFVTPAGKRKWIYAQARVVENADGTATAYSTFTDLSDQVQLQQQLSDVIQNVPCGICIYRWDGVDLTPLIVNTRYSEMLGEDALTYLESVDRLNFTHVHPEDLPDLQQAVQAALDKTLEFNITYRSLNYKTGEYLWIRARGKRLPQPDGAYLILVSFNDVTQEHRTEQQLRQSERELWAKYELERNRKSVDNEKLLVHAVFDLTTNTTLEYQYRDGTEVPPEDRTTFSFGKKNAELLIDDDERAQFLALNDADALLERFAQGETQFRLDYRRRQPDGDVTWVRNSMNLVRDPRSGDVLLFSYWYDIEEEKMFEQTYRSIVSDNYDFVARINGKTKHFVVFPRIGLTYHMPPLSGDDADAVTMTIYEDGVPPEDRALAINHSLVENINQNLRAHGRFQFTYRVMRPDGTVRYKRITQYYIDPQREIIAMLREDVTDLIRTETEKNEMLAGALSAANQASDAKSQFLSRVSHELRTPLNAIIGFMELARDADAQQIEACLNNSNVAAKQLLSIINDVLDMSSIEAGKLKLAHAPFDFRRLIQSISNIYVVQCDQKAIAFETKILTPLDEWLLGDQLRVNQILLNLLNNAVKFTERGYVHLAISQRDARDNKIFVRFSISDTGCGMSEEMQSRVFKPFEQQSAATAQKFGGNGLGLSIVNNLVNMMGGVVRVESREGVGSTFTVDLPFTKCEAAIATHTLVGVADLHVLAVDDEASEREYMSIVLNRLGVRHVCVGGGNSALDELARGEAEKDPYNICLVDWKMPDMNGIETTRRIREQYGKDVIVIVVSAYEHYHAAEGAEAAGANMFISKPLFQSSLFDLFVTLTGGRIVKPEAAPAARVFSGRRVLLAEDNAMNRMVAEGLVKKFGIICESVSDGRAAVDRFSASEPGYYDAILMDIQMPDMDGYEATRAIRASAHPEARTVQIIALTANAFNEDIAKSFSCGMNAHVAKPIEPSVLASALNAAFTANRRS